jgi:hypothetical protein
MLHEAFASLSGFIAPITALRHHVFLDQQARLQKSELEGQEFVI